MQQTQSKNAPFNKMEEIIKTPKNIRQIGDINDTYKIYIEDYVMTHIRQMGSRHGEASLVVMILVGQAYYGSDTDYLFISGAVEFKGAETQVSEVRLPEEGFKKVKDKIARYFPEADIVGWSVTYPDAGSILTSALKKIQVSYFGERQKVLLEVSLNDEEENFYTFTQGQFVKQPGFYIYYDKNEAMQGYMIDCMEVRKERTQEKAVADRVPARFREAIREKKEEVHQHKIMTYLYAASIFLLMVVFVIGITMINNYEKMTRMEAALNYISETIQEDETVLTQEEMDRFLEENSKKAAEITASQDSGVETGAAEEKADTAPVSGAAEEKADTAPVSGAAEEKADTAPVSGAANEKANTDPASGTADEQAGAASAPGTANEKAGAASASGTADKKADTSPEPGTADEQADTASAPGTEAGSSGQEVYYVQEGDTLAGISQKFYGTKSKIYEICEYNKIKDMNKILCGQKIVLP